MNKYIFLLCWITTRIWYILEEVEAENQYNWNTETFCVLALNMRTFTLKTQFAIVLVSLPLLTLNVTFDKKNSVKWEKIILRASYPFFNHPLCLRAACFLSALKPFPSFHSLLRDSILLSRAERRHWTTGSRLWLLGAQQWRGFYSAHRALHFNIIYFDHLAWDAATVEPVDKQPVWISS